MWKRILEAITAEYGKDKTSAKRYTALRRLISLPFYRQ